MMYKIEKLTCICIYSYGRLKRNETYVVEKWPDGYYRVNGYAFDKDQFNGLFMLQT